MFLDFTDIATQSFILRWVHAFAVLMVGVELFRSIHLVKNKRVMAIVYNASITLLFFFVGKIVAATLDDSYFSVGIASNIINICFWLFVYQKARIIRKSLQNEAVGETGRLRVSRSLDEILEEMDKTKKRVNRELSQIAR